MKPKKLHSDPQGLIAALQVVGVHGRFSDSQTPSRAAPVIADSQGRQVAIREASPAKGGGFRLTIDTSPRKIDDEVWSTTGTRIDPAWPARLGNIVAILGSRESNRAHELAQLAPEIDESPEVVEFLKWVMTNTPRSEDLYGVRVDGLVAWYCTRDRAASLWKRIAAIAKQDVFAAAARNQPVLLQQASLWLSRAATDDEQMFLAVAGTRRAGYQHWKALLDAGVRTGSEVSRLANVDAAEQLLPAQHAPSALKPASPRSHFARRAVLASIADLPLASQRAQVAA